MPRLLPRLPEDPDLTRLLNVERLARFVFLQRRALQIHSALGRPSRRRVGRRAPPDALAQSRRVWLEPQQSRGIRKHWARTWLRESFATQQIEEHLGMAAPEVCIGSACRRLVT